MYWKYEEYEWCGFIYYVCGMCDDDFFFFVSRRGWDGNRYGVEFK